MALVNPEGETRVFLCFEAYHISVLPLACPSLRATCVRMHLTERSWAASIIFTKRGEAIAESLEILLSEQLLPILVYEGGKRHAFVRTRGHHGLVAFDTAYFPAFADGCLIGFIPLNGAIESPPQIVLLSIGRNVHILYLVLSFKYRVIKESHRPTALYSSTILHA